MCKILKRLVAITLLTVSLFAVGCAAPASEPAESYSPSDDAGVKEDNKSIVPEAPQACEEPEDARAEESECDMAFDAPTCDDYWEEPPQEPTNEEYGEFVESTFLSPKKAPLSTFSIDVDTASYSNIRRFLSDGSLPPVDAVRVEECINYFSYDYTNSIGKHPIGVDVTISDCPWNSGRYLARVSVKAKELDLSEAPDGNIVFLLDVSGSMDELDKLPLVKSALTMLSENLSSDDKVSIVVYAGASGLILEGCSGADNHEIEHALRSLSAGGSTAGGEGIELAYSIAERHFIKGGNNRVILCTDGDFNVGPSSMDELEKLIERKRNSGVFLSVLGFGDGNIKDNKMETLADKGNGNYAYIDSLMEAKKVLVNEMSSTLYTVAKDVKVQVEFNPKAVKEYRLVGYDNRRLNDEDFNDDRKDAGEMGAGHTVTVFYEIILVGSDESSQNIDDLVFQDSSETPLETSNPASDWLYVKTRYKQPDAHESELLTVMAGQQDYTKNPDSDFDFASAVTEFALLLKNSRYMGDADFDGLIQRAKNAKGSDADGYRAQFIQLAELAEQLYKYQ